MFNRLKNNNYLDSRRFVNFNPDANTAWKSVMQPTYNAVLDDIEDQVIICYTEHKFHSDQMYYIIKFFDRYANRINTGVANDIQKEEIIVYPNPFYNRINIKNAKGNENFILTNALGQTIYFGKNVSERDFSHLDNGIYFITITDFGKKTPPQYFKLLKQ